METKERGKLTKGIPNRNTGKLIKIGGNTLVTSEEESGKILSFGLWFLNGMFIAVK